MSRPAGLALVRVLPLAVFAAGCWEKSGLDSGGALDSGPGAVGGGGGGNNGGGGGGGGGALTSCDIADFGLCYEMSGYAEAQQACEAIGQQGLTATFNEAGCPSGALGACAMPADDTVPVAYTLYFYDGFPAEDLEAACEEGGGTWRG